MYQVEYGVKDKEKAVLLHPTISDLESGRETLKDDFALNYLARKQFRVCLSPQPSYLYRRQKDFKMLPQRRMKL